MIKKETITDYITGEAIITYGITKMSKKKLKKSFNSIIDDAFFMLGKEEASDFISNNLIKMDIELNQKNKNKNYETICYSPLDDDIKLTFSDFEKALRAVKINDQDE